MSTSGPKRACDTCAALKTQCNLETPCARCARLNLTCTTDRPVKQKGRPLKAHGQNLEVRRGSRQPSRTKSTEVGGVSKIKIRCLFGSIVGGVGDSSSLIPEALKGLADLPLDHAIAARILEHLFSSTQQFGIIGGVIPRNSHLQVSSSGSPSYLSSVISSKVLLTTLLAMATRGLRSSLPPDRLEEAEELADKLRELALNSIPALAWKSSDQRLSHAISLLLLSNSSCFTDPSVEIAERWGSLAILIWKDMTHGNSSNEDISSEIQRRAVAALSIHDRVLSLLHFSRNPSYSIHTSKDQTESLTAQIPLVDDDLWHSNPYPNGDKFHLQGSSPGEGYFDLFLPLLRPLDGVLFDHNGGSSTHSRISAELEDYFLSFPVSLMCFSNVKYTFQVESMVWMHGIYTLLDASLDFASLLLDNEWPNTKGFVTALEHSLLLSEVIPTLIRIDPNLQTLSPATVVFVFLSCVVQSIGCSQFNPSHFLDMEHEQPQIPTTFKTSIARHLEFLSRIQCPSSRFNHPLMSIIQKVLQQACDTVTRTGHPANDILSPSPIQDLKYYRFIPSGTGIVPLNVTQAELLWKATLVKYQVNQTVSDFDNGSEQRRNVCHAINIIADPAARICEEGYFDLNIQYI